MSPREVTRGPPGNWMGWHGRASDDRTESWKALCEASAVRLELAADDLVRLLDAGPEDICG